MNRALFALLIAAVVGAVGWGLNAVGGPAFARMEKNDRQRIADLGKLGRHYACIHRDVQEDEAANRPDCLGAVDRDLSEIVDPTTKEAYPLSFEGDDRFRVCATFEIAPEDRKVYWSAAQRAVVKFDGSSGCILYERFKGKWYGRPRF